MSTRILSRTSACPRSPAAPTSSPASCSAIPSARCGAARSNARPWHGRRGLGRRGPAGAAEKGELVCTAPFPSHAHRLLERCGRQEFKAAYFDQYPNVWGHGDYAEITDHGGMIIYGRSDAVLNPGGVRIGTAEIYRQVERLPEMEESIVIDQEWQGDARMVLFVRLRHGLTLDETLVMTRSRPRSGTTRRPAMCPPGSSRCRHSAHQWQDRRTCRAQYRPWPAGEKPRGPGQSRSARAVQGDQGVAVVMNATRRSPHHSPVIPASALEPGSIVSAARGGSGDGSRLKLRLAGMTGLRRGDGEAS